MKYYLIKHKKFKDSAVLAEGDGNVHYMIWRTSIGRRKNRSISDDNWISWMEAINVDRTAIITKNPKDVERFIFMEAL